MSNTKTIVQSALSGVLALGFAAVSTAGPVEAQKGAEKCYGVVKAGKNDCQTASSACAGTSKRDGQRDAWIYVPAGSCAKIVGASTSAKG